MYFCVFCVQAQRPNVYLVTTVPSAYGLADSKGRINLFQRNAIHPPPSLLAVLADPKNSQQNGGVPPLPLQA